MAAKPAAGAVRAGLDGDVALDALEAVPGKRQVRPLAVEHQVEEQALLVIPMLIRMSAKGAETTLGEIRARLRCHKCGSRRVRLGLYAGVRSAR